jgi:hypothetical protein
MPPPPMAKPAAVHEEHHRELGRVRVAKVRHRGVDVEVKTVLGGGAQPAAALRARRLVACGVEGGVPRRRQLRRHPAPGGQRRPGEGDAEELRHGAGADPLERAAVELGDGRRSPVTADVPAA